jgi:hypothetical protein
VSSLPETVRGSITAARIVFTDTARWPFRRRSPNPSPHGIDRAVGYLLATHDATGRNGCSRGFTLVRGWAPAFPETTGYIIGTLLAFGDRSGRRDLVDRAREMGDWEIEVQGDDGGIMEGLVTQTPRKSIAFNTGMVMHGWLDLVVATGDQRYLAAAERAGAFLARHQSPDGAWRGEHSYAGIPHTYHSRVDWALLRLWQATGDDSFRQAAIRNLDWVLSMQQPNGWFEQCIFRPGQLPNTHAIAYTLRGLLESSRITDDDRYLAAAERTADELIPRFRELQWLPGVFDRSWRARAWWECLTGTVQLGGVWLRLFEIAGDPTYLDAGTAAIDRAAGWQVQSSRLPISGALAGSLPIYGRYAPLKFPNWATKFLADSLMIRERCAAESNDSREVGRR